MMRRRLLKARIRKLRRIWKRSRRHRPGKGRLAFYKYLLSVLRFYAELRRTQGQAKSKRDALADLYGLSRSAHLFNVILSASSSEDRRTQSRWALCLRYVWKFRRQIKRHKLSVREFFQPNGGVAGCAAKFAKGIPPKFQTKNASTEDRK